MNKTLKIILSILLTVVLISSIISTIVLGVEYFKNKENINILTSRNIELSNTISTKDKILEEKKKELEKSQEEITILNGAGVLATSVIGKIEDLYMRYDEVFVSAYNYCVNNVEWNYTGAYDMKSFLKEQQKIQKDYNTLINSLDTITN